MRNLKTIPGLLLVIVLLLCNTVFGQIARSVSGMVVSEFKTSSGDITVILPDDIRAGDVITGTVTALPDGKNEKDKKKNMEKLQELAITFSGSAIKLNDLLKEENNRFSFTMPTETVVDENNMAGLELFDKGKNIGRSLVPVTTAKLLTPSLPNALVQLDNPLIEASQPFVVVRSPNADLKKYETIVRDKNGLPENITARCSSPREMILELPSNTAIGDGSVTLRSKGPGNNSENIVLKFSVVKISYEIQKNNLQKNETTLLKGTITGMNNRVHHNPTLVIENETAQTIALENGNDQSIYVNAATGNFYFERLITGITPGRFTINAVLNLHPADMPDPFSYQLRTLQTAAEFNNWLDALKYDLKKLAGSQPKNNAEKIDQQNAKTILQNLKACTDIKALQPTKIYDDNLLRSLGFDAKTIQNWDCSFISEETALKPLENQVARLSEKPVDWEMLKLFAENIQTRAEKAGYKRSIGPMVNSVLMRLAVTVAYSVSSRAYINLTKELYTQLTNAASSLPDEFKPAYNRPDPINDFVGFIDPEKKTLWVVQQELPGIINYLGAVKAANGSYNFKSVNIFGRPVSSTFTIAISTPAQIRSVFRIWADAQLNQAAAAANKKDSAGNKTDSVFKPGQFLKRDTVNGTFYKLFKNAKCAKYTSGDTPEPTQGDGDCEAQTATRWKNGMTDQMIIDSVNKNPSFEPRDYQETYNTGRYLKVKWNPVNKCGIGKAYCTEVKIAACIISIFDEEGCSLMISQYTPEGGYRFSCKSE